MNQTKIQEIVTKVFDKAKAECAVHTKNALCNHVSDHTRLSTRTLDRLHDKYITQKIKAGEQSEHTINSLCDYLGYDSYAAYAKEHAGGIAAGNSKTDAAYVKEQGVGIAAERSKRGSKWKRALVISLILGVGVIFFFGYKEYSRAGECMVWEKDHFEVSPCVPHSYKNIEPLDPVRLANFKKIEVDAGHPFFNEITNKPRVWYHKTKSGEIEYYTAPGLHPINGKTLDEITPYIIDKYVPIHNFKPTSFTD